MPFSAVELDHLAQIDSNETQILLAALMTKLDAGVNLIPLTDRMTALEASVDSSRQMAIDGYTAIIANAQDALATMGVTG